jgi:hypothetical protein
MEIYQFWRAWGIKIKEGYGECKESRKGAGGRK